MVAFHLLIKSFCRNFIKFSQIPIQHDFLSADHEYLLFDPFLN